MIGQRVCLVAVKRGIQCSINNVSEAALFPLISRLLPALIQSERRSTSHQMLCDINAHYLDRGSCHMNHIHPFTHLRCSPSV